MRKNQHLAGVAFWTILLAPLFLIACKKDSQPDAIDPDISSKVLALGFSPAGLEKLDNGYLIEGDIFLSNADLDSRPESRFLRIAGDEQYRTFNLITALPRTITISLSAQCPSSYNAGLDEAIRRYNEENIQLHFQRANKGDISVIRGYGNFIAVSGLPGNDGKPYSTIQLNTIFIGTGNGTSNFTNYLASLIAHEIGHCIGFRHTDYMSRNFSCKGKPVNEGAGQAGAVNIPGTPVGVDASSWMLACIAVNENRLFDENDKVALQYLY
jgi:Dual-action HEIGH metallo-peptidase